MKRIKHIIFWLLIAGLILLLFSTHVIAEDSFQQQRELMIENIKAELTISDDFLSQASFDELVFAALRKVPRHEFVPENQRIHAYENRPLSIGYGQTISQPYIVAIMTSLLNLKKTDRVLEVGTGSGYQAAVLAELAGSVYTIEILEELGKQAVNNLNRTGYKTVHTRIGDGYSGWEEAAPFDGIAVTAVVSQLPPSLIKQLKPGGRMIIPVGKALAPQYLVLVTKDADNKVSTRQIVQVSFVPLTGQH